MAFSERNQIGTDAKCPRKKLIVAQQSNQIGTINYDKIVLKRIF